MEKMVPIDPRLRQERKGQHRCLVCGRDCTNPQGLAAHMQTHNPNRKKRKVKKAKKLATKIARAEMITLSSENVSIQFSSVYLPEVLHTIAFAMSGQKTKRQ